MAKRGQNEGSIYQRKDGLWAAAISTPTGKKVAYARTRALAAQKLQQLQQKFATGTLEAAGSITVEKLMAEYLDHKRPGWRVRSYEAAEAAVRLRIVPSLGSVRLDALTPHRCQQWTRGLGQRRAAKIAWQHLHAACDLAVRWGWIVRNPLDATDAPAVPRHQPPELSRELLQGVLEATRGGPDFPIVCLLLGCGLRISEALGLRWQDWDREGKTIAVVGQLGRVGDKWAHVPPKTRAGSRVVALPSWVQAELEGMEPGEPGEFLFGGVDRSAVGKRVRARLAEAGISGVRLHDLRHAYASLLIDASVPITRVSAALGHSSPAVTMAVYAHKLGTVDRQAAEALEGFLPAKKPEGRPLL